LGKWFLEPKLVQCGVLEANELGTNEQQNWTEALSDMQ
jgi:hypothetical protein